MATSSNVVSAYSSQAQASARVVRLQARYLDVSLIAGFLLASGVVVVGAWLSGAGASYFLHTRGAAIVLGGTLGVMVITTPASLLARALGRAAGLLVVRKVRREAVAEQMVQLSRAVRFGGLATIESLIPKLGWPLLRESLMVALQAENRTQLEQTLKARLKMLERQADAEARVFEVAGSFAPTLGILGTVVGLIEVLRSFGNLQLVGAGIGTAFVATIYGLGVANLILLPLAHRIRARAWQELETGEMLVEGVLALYEQDHPALMRERMQAYLKTK